MSADLTKLSEEAQSLARVPLFKRLEPHELEHVAEEVQHELIRSAVAQAVFASSPDCVASRC